MESPAGHEAEPRCERCGGKLHEEGRPPAAGPAAGALILASLALCLWPLALPGALRYPLIAAGVAGGLWLAARPPCWRCASCKARFVRRPPPRGSLENRTAEDQMVSSSDSPPDTDDG
jgi:hypothetical protein